MYKNMKKNLLLLMLSIFGLVLQAQKGNITSEMLNRFEENYTQKGEQFEVLQNAVSNNSIKKLALNRNNVGKVDTHFSNQVKSSGITNQESSGRCWLFTGLNVLRAQAMKKKNVKELFLSHNYLFFYDQLEKANLFLEGIIETRDLPLDNRKVQHFLNNAIGDGGQWTGVVDLVKKYGVVPTEVFPETEISNKTATFSKLLGWKLKEDALELRGMQRASDNTIRDKKEQMLSEIYQMLCISLGTPPKSFDYRYEDKDGVITKMQTYTPLSFAKEFLNVDLDAYLMFMNDPTRPYYKVYEIEFDRHTYDGHNWKYLNLPTKEIKEFAKNSILDDEAMYFSCDVGKQLEKKSGTLDINNFNYGLLFGVDFGMDKKERIQTRASGSSHGMTLVAVDIDDKGNINKWLLENSWGKSYGHNGFLIMTDEWFDEYMFRLVINKKYISEKTLKLFDQKPILLPIWDPMFSMDD